MKAALQRIKNYRRTVVGGLLVVGAALLIVAPGASADHAFGHPGYPNNLDYNPNDTQKCTFLNVGNTPTNTVGTGYIYRTIEIRTGTWGEPSMSGTVQGQTYRANCTLTTRTGNDPGYNASRDLPSTLEWHGLEADQIWFGPEATGGPASQAGNYQCAAWEPDIGRITRCPNGNRFEVAQDDAAWINFGGTEIYCNGIVEKCGNNVYVNGTQDAPRFKGLDCASEPADSGCPVRGAGYYNQSPQLLRSGSSASQDIDLEIWGRNTYSWGWATSFFLTIRYPRDNATINVTANCNARNVRVQTNSVTTPSVQLRVNGSLVTTRASKDFTHSMSSYNQNNAYSVTATTVIGGVTFTDTETYNCPPPDSGACDEIPPSQTLNMPDNSPNTGGPPSYGYGTHYEYNPTGRSSVTSVQDISPGVGSVSIPYTGGTNHRVTLYYSNFENTYPYDNNQARVNYVSYYDTRVYTASGSAVYTDWYDVCTRYEYVNVGTPQKPRYEYRCTRTRRQRDLLGYRYVYQYTNYNNAASGSVNGSYMDPCYDRAFELTPDTVSVTFDDYEDPDRVSFNSSISSRFTLPQGNYALRRPMQVNFSASGNYYVKRANGGTIGYPLGANSRQIDSSMNIGSTYSPTTMTRSFTDVFDAEMPPLQVGDQACFTITVATSRGQMNVPGNITRTLSGAMTSDEVCSNPLVNHPYLRVYGGDVLAGGGFGVGCSINTNARIITWGRSNGTGSAVEFAAQAAGSITDFSSASGRSSAPTSPRGLSFGNTSGTFGGNFGSGSCNRDYWAAARDVQSSYRSTGQVVPEGARQVRYVDGDAYLYGNIMYSNSTGWSSIDRIPSFYLIVRGNIYIDRAVTQLDGAYIAQPHPNRSNTGRIYTCTSNDRVITNTSAFSLCDQKLTINGAFMASQVRFLRTNGSLRDSRTGEASSSSTIAEVFNYSPEMYLVDPVIFEMPTKQYESATGLPPVL